MSPERIFIFAILWCKCYIPGTYANTISKFKVSRSSNRRLFYEKLLDIVTVRSSLDCAVHCSRSLRCGGYKFHATNGTCHITQSVMGSPSKEKMDNVKFTFNNKIEPVMCTEAPDVPNTEKATEGYFTGAVTKYTCTRDYTPCDNKPTSVCQSTGQWGDVTGICRQYRWFNPKDHVKYFLPCGSSSRFKATLNVTLPNSKKFSVNVRADNDILVHIAIHVDDRALVLNSLIDEKWRTQIRKDNLRMAPKTDVTIVIIFNNGQAKIRFGSSFKTSYTCPATDPQVDHIVMWHLDGRLLEIRPWYQ